MKRILMALAALPLLALAACGNDAQTRMLTGAGIGAVGGALLGGITTPQQPVPVNPGHYRGRHSRHH
jgi:hypothetical protein